MYLASALRAWAGQKHEIEILDLRLYRRRHRALQRKLVEWEPDIVGFSTLTFEAEEMHQAAGTVKQWNRRCPVIVGGPHGTIFYSEILDDRNIDYVVVGEGEISLVELVDFLAERVTPPHLPGVAFSRDGEVTFPGHRQQIADPDTIPFPAWDLIDIDLYRRNPDFNGGLGSGRYMGLFTSRACPYQCVYCHSIFGKGFRARSPESVLEEMGILASHYGIKEFQIFDDCFNLDRKRTLSIAGGIVNRGYRVQLSFPNALRADLLDKEVLSALKQAGAYVFTAAVETASPRLQKLIRKNLDLEKTREVITLADRMGYLVKGFFMIGFPTETREEMRATIRFAMESPLFFAIFFTVVPFPKTELYEMMRESSAGQNFTYRDYHYLLYRKRNPDHESGVNLRWLQKISHAKFYFCYPGRMVKGIIRSPNPLGYLSKTIYRGVKIVCFR